MKIKCSNCGAKIPAAGKVCPLCGADKTADVQQARLMGAVAMICLAIGFAVGVWGYGSLALGFGIGLSLAAAAGIAQGVIRGVNQLERRRERANAETVAEDNDPRPVRRRPNDSV